MSNQLLKGKRGIITGALDQHSIAWKIAEKAHEQGAIFTLSNAPLAMRLGEINKLADKTGAEIIPADATSMDDIHKLFEESTQKLGGKIDFFLHSIGMSMNVRKGNAYTELSYDLYQKTIDISALSLHRMLSTAYKQDAINQGGSVVALSYIAAQRAYPFYSDMSEAKAMLESIVRNFGYHYGKAKGVRVNSVSQSPTKTRAGGGIKGFDNFFNYADASSPLGNATAEDCANFCITLFSDLSKGVTMQNIFHDGGYSATGVTLEAMEKFNEE